MIIVSIWFLFQLKLDGNSPVYTYPCKSGIVVIIANEKFKDSKKDRQGTHTDITKIKETFSKIDCEVHAVIKDRKVSQMKEYFKKHLCDPLNEGYMGSPDFLICFIMSHGNEHGIEGVDGEHVTIAELAESLESDKCSALKGKPKLFFIQACRGEKAPDAVRLDNTSLEDRIVMDGKITAIPPGADFLFGYSTVQNNVSLRREQSGSFYIQILCDMIDKYASKLSLHDIIMLVHQTLATDDKYIYEDKDKVSGVTKTYRQMAEMMTTLRGHVYFKFALK